MMRPSNPRERALPDGNIRRCRSAVLRFLHDAIHAAAHEHAATFHVNRAHAVGKQHDREDEPRRGLANVALGFATGVTGRGSEVVQNNCSGSPERNKGEHGRSGHEHARQVSRARAFWGREYGLVIHSDGAVGAAGSYGYITVNACPVGVPVWYLRVSDLAELRGVNRAGHAFTVM